MSLTPTIHGISPPSDWIVRWAHLAVPGATVLDLACGSGRHLRWWAARGHPVTGVDVNGEALASLKGLGELVQADLENAPWPLGTRQFDVVVVTNYLWRPLWPAIVNALAPGGVLLYETFACGNETVGRPSRPDFLLQPAELIERCAGLQIVAFEDGYLPDPARFVQRIAAGRPLLEGAPRRRFHLSNPNSTQG
jgi:SAM-dependent methyltransferase